jgi:hypothetical protein
MGTLDYWTCMPCIEFHDGHLKNASSHLQQLKFSMARSSAAPT